MKLLRACHSSQLLGINRPPPTKPVYDKKMNRKRLTDPFSNGIPKAQNRSRQIVDLSVMPTQRIRKLWWYFSVDRLWNKNVLITKWMLVCFIFRGTALKCLQQSLCFSASWMNTYVLPKMFYAWEHVCLCIFVCVCASNTFNRKNNHQENDQFAYQRFKHPVRIVMVRVLHANSVKRRWSWFMNRFSRIIHKRHSNVIV